MDIHGNTFYLFLPLVFFYFIYPPFHLDLTLITLDGIYAFYFNIDFFYHQPF